MDVYSVIRLTQLSLKSFVENSGSTLNTFLCVLSPVVRD